MPPRTASTRAAIGSAAVAVVLVATSMIVPRVLDEDVRVNFPPLHADWDPRFTWQVPVVALIGVVLVLVVPRLAARLSWPQALVLAFSATWTWIMAVAFTEGPEGLSRVFDRKGEYVYDAQRVGDVGQMMREFISRIPAFQDDSWHTHVAGHPPGALLYFVGLDRIGVTSSFWIGVVTVTVGATAVVAVLLTVRELADESAARRCIPWLVLAPTAVYMGVNGDAMFTAVAAWGLYLLARAAKRSSIPSALGAGLVLGLCIFLSYGLVLLGILAVAVLLIARTWKPLPWAVGGALVVVAVFAVAGFAWWEAYPVLHERYYAGIASERAYSYWVWADIAAWTFTIGLAVWAAFPTAWTRVRTDPVVQLAAAAVLTVVVASVSGMSKAEVERIFMPFTIWVVALPMLLPERWHRGLLLSQVVLTLLLSQLLLTRW